MPEIKTVSFVRACDIFGDIPDWLNAFECTSWSWGDCYYSMVPVSIVRRHLEEYGPEDNDDRIYWECYDRLMSLKLDDNLMVEWEG